MVNPKPRVRITSSHSSSDEKGQNEKACQGHAKEIIAIFKLHGSSNCSSGIGLFKVSTFFSASNMFRYDESVFMYKIGSSKLVLHRQRQ